IEIGQADDVDHRRAKGHRRADRRIKHPCSNDDRYARFGLNDGNVSARAPFGVQLPDLATMQGVPAVMDFNVLVDMGRMNPRWPYQGKTVSLAAAIRVRRTGPGSPRLSKAASRIRSTLRSTSPIY